MSTFLDTIDAALAADLTKNELKVVLAFLRQTFGYGKGADPLTFGRVAMITGIRKDRVQAPMSSVTDKGIFGMRDHKVFGQEIFVAEEFLTQDKFDFYSPTIPLSGETSRSLEENPGERGHTVNTITPSTITTTTTPDNIEPNCGGGEFEFVLPSEITGAKNQKVCQKALEALEQEQCFDVIVAFSAMAKKGGIKSPTPYLLSLVKRCKQGSLTVESPTPNPTPNPTAVLADNKTLLAINKASIDHGMNNLEELLGRMS